MPASLIGACLAVPPAADEGQSPAGAAGAARTGAAPAPIDWSQGDCLSQLRLLQQAASAGRLGPEARPPFAVQLVAAPGDWLDAVPPLPIEADLPLADAAAPGDAVRCVLRIGPARDQTAAHRAVDVEDVRSAYQSALRSERNPDYDAAQLEHREAKEDTKGAPQVVRVGDPLLDLIGTTVGGVIGAFDRVTGRHQVDAAAAELAATPRSRDRPVYRPYGFERVVVRAQKQAVVPVALLDAAGRELRATELRQREQREFYMLRGLDPRDRDYEQHRSSSMTRADLARWARTPPALRLSTVAVALTDGAAAETRLAELAPAAGPASAAPADLGPEPQPWPEDAALAQDPDLPLLADWIDDPQGGVPGPDQAPPGGVDLAALVPGTDRSPVAPAAAGAGAQPRAPSIVAVDAGGAAGHGFYVREDLVLTSYELVQAISVVDVTTAEGATVPALVAALDPDRGLALLQVPRPGPPAALYEGSAPPVPPPGAGGPGLPVLLDDQVVGMTSGAAGASGQRVVPIDAIRAFLASQAALLAALP